MAKYKGKDLSLTFGTEEINLEATAVVLQNEEADGDAVTFAELQGGTAVQWFFEITAVSDYGADSFWSFLWDNSGADVAFVFKPYGNATPTTTQPHFTGTATVVSKPPIGGTAGEVFTFETRLDVVGEPARVTTGV